MRERMMVFENVGVTRKMRKRNVRMGREKRKKKKKKMMMKNHFSPQPISTLHHVQNEG
jgi:hypothetical protein